MRVLFVCKSNVGRSQIAEAFFNSVSGQNIAASAGITPKDEGYEGRKIGEAGPTITAAMREFKIDVSEQVSKQLTEGMVHDADLIVYMHQGELPALLRGNQKVRTWNVEDPRGTDLHQTVTIANGISERVLALRREIESVDKG